MNFSPLPRWVQVTDAEDDGDATEDDSEAEEEDFEEPDDSDELKAVGEPLLQPWPEVASDYADTG